MRGKNKIWMTMAAVFIASLAISMMSIPKAYADNIVSVVNPLNGTSEFGPFGPGDAFSANVVIDYIEGLRSFEFTLSWNPNTLRLSSGAPAVEGPFLPSGGPTFFVKSIGVAGESITVADLIMQGGSWVDGSGVLATVNFEVIGGGQCNLDLTAKLLDVNFGEMYVATVGGRFFSPFPYIAFKYFVPTPILSGDTINVTGMGHYMATDQSGNPAAYNTVPYTIMRPVIHLDPLTGYPANYELVSGTMFFGDDIIFDASGSYDLDNSGQVVPLPASAFHWVIRAGGMDKIRGRDTRYESGVELPFGPTFTYNFPGPLNTYSLYGPTYLGWHDLQLTVTDSDGNVATYSTWLRIFRLSPARMSMVTIPGKHVRKGDAMQIGVKIQNRAGTSAWPWTALQSYVELGRMISGFIWTRAKLTIKDSSGNTVATLYTDAMLLQGTEIPTAPMYLTWTVPNNLAPGMYSVTAKGGLCGNGIGYGLSASGSADSWFEVLP